MVPFRPMLQRQHQAQPVLHLPQPGLRDPARAAGEEIRQAAAAKAVADGLLALVKCHLLNRVASLGFPRSERILQG